MNLRNSLPVTDQRYHASRYLETQYDPPRFEALTAWEERAAWLREHILVVMGLWPLPERARLKAQVFGRIEYDDYAVEKAYFESWPGFYCTGNLYRPRGMAGPFPGILNPHGHWERGRLHHDELGSIRARCITLARMGMVAFAYDMVGYNDSRQVPLHRFASLRGSLWDLAPMALQTWNSLRAVDFLQSLNDVDPGRIGCTGASGGGTQTFIATAIEPRIQVSAPVNMISAHYQGGCVCENIPGLRSQTNNVEIAALMAPRPLLMVSATGDWTCNTPTVEYPAVRGIYGLYGAEDRVAFVQVDAPHNYNAESRAHVYRWFARWFLGDESRGEGAEREFVVEPDERMRVFPSGALPEGAPVGRALEEALQRATRERLQALMPSTPDELERLREITSTRLTHVLGVTVPQPEDLLAEPGDMLTEGPALRQGLALGRAGAGDRVPAARYTPAEGSPRRMALIVHGAGRAALQDGYGGAGEALRALLDAGYGVLALDPFGVGDVPQDAVARHEDDWLWIAHNAPLIGARVQDLLTGIAYAATQAPGEPVTLVGLGAAGAWALLAAALSPVACRVAVDMQAVTPDDDGAFLGTNYIPLFRAYGDLRVVGALVAPRPLALFNTAGRFPLDWAQAAYGATGTADRFEERKGPFDVVALLSWLAELDAKEGAVG